MNVELGKIKSVEFGHGGYQDACIGVTFVLGGESWGVSDFWGDWAIERSSHASWTEDGRIKKLGSVTMRIAGLLADAKVSSISQLKGVPIEVTFEGTTLKSWRVLKEVL